MFLRLRLHRRPNLDLAHRRRRSCLVQRGSRCDQLPAVSFAWMGMARARLVQLADGVFHGHQVCLGGLHEASAVASVALALSLVLSIIHE